jgi:ribosome-binding protein aMBF1 (putative translation factor)
MSKPKTKTTDGLEILHRRFLQNKPESQSLLNEISLNARVAQMIYTARKEKGLTQKQLAEIVGTTQSVIARIEDVNYEGHSLSLLQRISQALGQRLEIDITPIDQRGKVL